MVLINPQHACARVTVVILWVSEWVCVCYHASCHIPRLYVENQVSISFLWRFPHMHYVDFIENALFRSSCDICWPAQLSSLLNRLSMEITNSDDFFSRWLVCRSSDRSYNSTGWSLIIVNCQLSFLTWASSYIAIYYTALHIPYCTCDTHMHLGTVT